MTAITPNDDTPPRSTGCAASQSAPNHNENGKVDLSVVLPFRNERDNLPELLDRLAAVLDPLGLVYELVFVDDGSTDDSLEFLEERAQVDPRIKVLVFSRNFGQQIAVTAGIDAAAGEMIVWMVSDLQERPEDIPRLIDKYREGFDIVYTTRVARRQSRVRAAASYLFVSTLNRIVGLDSCRNRACLRLFSRNVADGLRRFSERQRYMAYLMPWMGYRTTEIRIDTDERRRGRTNYTWVRMMTLGLSGLTSFSAAPLRLSAVLSLLALLCCVLGGAWVLYGYFTHGYGVSGWTSLIMLLLILHGAQFAVLAIVGEYVGLAYTEMKRRPLYLCSRTINFPPREAASRFSPHSRWSPVTPTVRTFTTHVESNAAPANQTEPTCASAGERLSEPEYSI